MCRDSLNWCFLGQGCPVVYILDRHNGYNNSMNLRKKPVPPTPQAGGSDQSNEMSKMDEPSIAERPNRRISQAAKHLINFIMDINKETREARKKKDRRQEEEIQKPEPVKKQRTEKAATVANPPPKQISKPVQKPDVPREPLKNNELYKFVPENPFSIEGMDPSKKGLPIQGFPYEYLMPGNGYFQPNQYIMGLQGMPNFPGMQGLTGLPIQNIQGIQGMQGLSGMQGLMALPGNKQPYFGYGNNYIRVPMQYNQQPIPAPQNIQDYRNMRFNERKIFKRASYHVAIAYNIHIQKLKKKPQADQIDQAFIDPTYCARKMREQNRGDNREIGRDAESAGTKEGQ